MGVDDDLMAIAPGDDLTPSPSPNRPKRKKVDDDDLLAILPPGRRAPGGAIPDAGVEVWGLFSRCSGVHATAIHFACCIFPALLSKI
jgi:hypothetical protein